MRIAPIGLTPIKNNTVKSKNSSSVSFVGINNERVEKYIQKEKEAEKYFKEAVYPQAEINLKKINDEIRDAIDLYFYGKNKALKSYTKDDNTTILYDSKIKGLKKVRTIRIFEGNALKKEIEVTSVGNIKIKEFKDSVNSYNTYEYNNLTGNKKYCENVREKGSCVYNWYRADSIYTYEQDSLRKYEERYSFFDAGKHKKQLNIEKCYDLGLSSKYIKYYEDIKDSYDSNPKFVRFEGHIVKGKIEYEY